MNLAKGYPVLCNGVRGVIVHVDYDNKKPFSVHFSNGTRAGYTLFEIQLLSPNGD